MRVILRDVFVYFFTPHSLPFRHYRRTVVQESALGIRNWFDTPLISHSMFHPMIFLAVVRVRGGGSPAAGVVQFDAAVRYRHSFVIAVGRCRTGQETQRWPTSASNQ